MSMKLHCLVIVGFLAYLTAGQLREYHPMKDYFANIERESFNDAFDICKTQNLHLATIKNDPENGDLLSYIGLLIEEEFDRKFWISGRKTSSGWQWQETNETITWFDWGHGKYEDLNADDGDCILLTINHFDEGSWMKASCDEKHYSICENLGN